MLYFLHIAITILDLVCGAHKSIRTEAPSSCHVRYSRNLQFDADICDLYTLCLLLVESTNPCLANSKDQARNQQVAKAQHDGEIAIRMASQASPQTTHILRLEYVIMRGNKQFL
jgi:hypothetical protein